MPFALKLREASTITLMDECKDAQLNAYDAQQGFYAYLTSRICFDPIEANGMFLDINSINEGNINAYVLFYLF